MALYLETLVRSVQNQTNNFTRHTGFICVLTLIALTILQGWMVTLPWETDDSSLIGVSIGLSEVGCLIGATILSVFPQRRRHVHVLLMSVGVIGCFLGIFAIDTGHVETTVLIIAFTCIGIATSIQPITVIVPVKTEAETSVNANAYSMCRQLSYATTLIFAFMYTYLGWSFLCVFTVVLLLLAMAITFNVEKVSSERLLTTETTEEKVPFREAVRHLPMFIWATLFSFSASGFTEGVTNSMAMLVLKDIWLSAKSDAFTRSMICPLIAVVIYPFISSFVNPRKQFLLAMGLLGVFIALYPFMPNALLGFFMLTFWNVGKTCMHSSVYSVIREATDDGSVIARLVALEQWTCTLFYGLAGVIGGTLFDQAYWLPFLVAGILQIFLLGCSLLAFMSDSRSHGQSFIDDAVRALNEKPVPTSESQQYLVLE
ncbi:uncharacterized protein LOC134851101 [Symsagittifera roscoffensis]|uniref:uncharacterized protein LOC134851101 n=1 Tax=Symsagittifera roscoffensis TaxID=84072 RepID=UPI00307B57BC